VSALGDSIRLLAGQVDDQDAAHVKRIDELTATVADLRQQLEAKTSARFPADPGPGRLWWGASRKGNGTVDFHRTATGRPLPLRRRYFQHTGWAGADSSLVRAAAAAHAAGHLPWLSFKADWQQLASGALDSQIDGMIAGLEKLTQSTVLTWSHEPEDDGGDPAAWRAGQRRIRDRLTAANARRIPFVPNLMVWSFDPRSGRNVDDWWAGGGVWDFYTVNHYTPTHDLPIIRTVLTDALAYATSKGLPLGIGEWGVRPDDPKGAAKIREFYEWLIANGAVMASYFDSDVNSTGAGWMLDGDRLAAFHQRMVDPRTAALGRA
jgi:hypothetical protein